MGFYRSTPHPRNHYFEMKTGRLVHTVDNADTGQAPLKIAECDS